MRKLSGFYGKRVNVKKKHLSGAFSNMKNNHLLIVNKNSDEGIDEGFLVSYCERYRCKKKDMF
ncbi:hypothetical protein Saga11_09750 [Bacillus safensis]|nr:hypothetical protein Saga11_09750 [Bacillus safensis]